ncbi:MAG: hypothetical protein JXO49_00365 [Deltaproteobacteria bacterium]|nr:hypothetical protein [Candidatus Anaeroferrophillus wilburensis]MBN2887777.1 hypothetical protein [Deltaproteobacteria bacterium]
MEVSQKQKVHVKSVTVKMRLSDGSTLVGEVNLLAEGGVGRLSELFTKGNNPFMVVFNAMQQGKAGQTFVVNKKQILWAGLDETQGCGQHNK